VAKTPEFPARYEDRNSLLLAGGRSAADNPALDAQFTAAAGQSTRLPAMADEPRDTFMFR
jgi:hypothetical protein